MRSHRLVTAFLALFGGLSTSAPAQSESSPDLELDRYFEARVAAIEARTKRILESADSDSWPGLQGELRKELAAMLGIHPWPKPKTALEAQIAGQTRYDDILVERVRFQSLPDLHVTGNLYRPAEMGAPLPAILYVCGHAGTTIDGVPHGNKVNYQRHGAWFARNGYVCLIIDTVQLGEIEGIHHGAYRYDRWDWHSRGYTPAGIEAWNGIRALDYLTERPEVDASRIGMTGRSGGGAYTWWVAALDERVAVSVPVAGITSLRNHVVDRCVEGHCDCMYFYNTRQWGFPLLASLIAPRPLLIVNTDKDAIFPLDGVYNVYQSTRGLYENLDALPNIGLAIEEGPHKDTQPLRVSAFHWFERFLKGRELGDELVDARAPSLFEPQELKVFDRLPSDSINATIDTQFIPRTPPDATVSDADLIATLQRDVFGAWPAKPEPPEAKLVTSAQSERLEGKRYHTLTEPFNSCELITLRQRPSDPTRHVQVYLASSTEWDDFTKRLAPIFPSLVSSELRAEATGDAEAAPRRVAAFPADAAIVVAGLRGVVSDNWGADARRWTHIRRSFALLGMTVWSARVWDAIRVVDTIRSMPEYRDATVELVGFGDYATVALHAAYLSHDIDRVTLGALSLSNLEGPEALNIHQIISPSRMVERVAARIPTVLFTTKPHRAEWVEALRPNDPVDRVSLELRDLSQWRAPLAWTRDASQE